MEPRLHDCLITYLGIQVAEPDIGIFALLTELWLLRHCWRDEPARPLMTYLKILVGKNCSRLAEGEFVAQAPISWKCIHATFHHVSVCVCTW